MRGYEVQTKCFTRLLFLVFARLHLILTNSSSKIFGRKNRFKEPYLKNEKQETVSQKIFFGLNCLFHMIVTPRNPHPPQKKRNIIITENHFISIYIRMPLTNQLILSYFSAGVGRTVLKRNQKPKKKPKKL